MIQDIKLQKYLQYLSDNYSIPRDHTKFLWNLKLKQHLEPKVIYDIGCNVLHWTKAASKVWKDAEYILFDAYEPASFLYKDYRHHVGLLSDEDGKILKFYQNDQYPGGNSYYREVYTKDVFTEDSYVVKEAMTLDTIVSKNKYPKPDLVKIDVQGSEIDILIGAAETIKYSMALIVELQNVEYNKGAPLASFSLPFIEKMGFTCIEQKFSDNGPDADYFFVNNKYIDEED